MRHRNGLLTCKNIDYAGAFHPSGVILLIPRPTKYLECITFNKKTLKEYRGRTASTMLFIGLRRNGERWVLLIEKLGHLENQNCLNKNFNISSVRIDERARNFCSYA